MMRAADALRSLAALPLLTFAEAFANESIAILAPHPDDESLGCGGLIAEACAEGWPPIVIALTDGTGSHPNSRLYPAPRLRALREAELFAATRQLGLPSDRVLFLGYRDTAAPHEGPALHHAAERLAGILKQTGCSTLLAPWRHDPHCDHAAAAAIADLACRRTSTRHLAYPVWGLTLPPETLLPDAAPTGFRIDIASQLNLKRAAIYAHRSQYGGLIPDDPGGFQMQPDFIDLFLTGIETFLDTGAARQSRAA